MHFPSSVHLNCMPNVHFSNTAPRITSTVEKGRWFSNRYQPDSHTFVKRPFEYIHHWKSASAKPPRRPYPCIINFPCWFLPIKSTSIRAPNQRFMNRELVYRNLLFLVLPFLLFPIDQLMASDLRRHSSLIFDAWHSLFPGSRVETKVISGIQIKYASYPSY